MYLVGCGIPKRPDIKPDFVNLKDCIVEVAGKKYLDLDGNCVYEFELPENPLGEPIYKGDLPLRSLQDQFCLAPKEVQGMRNYIASILDEIKQKNLDSKGFTRDLVKDIKHNHGD